MTVSVTCAVSAELKLLLVLASVLLIRPKRNVLAQAFQATKSY